LIISFSIEDEVYSALPGGSPITLSSLFSSIGGIGCC